MNDSPVGDLQDPAGPGAGPEVILPVEHHRTNPSSRPQILDQERSGAGEEPARIRGNRQKSFNGSNPDPAQPVAGECSGLALRQPSCPEDPARESAPADPSLGARQ